MMISPEGYYEFNLKGKTQQEIMSEIQSLENEIRELRKEVKDASRGVKAVEYPTPLTRLQCYREYLKRAIQAYEEAGGVYKPIKK